MKFITPSYYRFFRCTADKCSDNCCIGWEIEIDDATATLYRSIDGNFGDRLRKNITTDNCFILQNDRCPFLNETGLCDIIIHCGEDHLCQICRDHPRYFEWFPDRKEGGLGLSCEEAARLILTTDRVTYEQAETDEEPEDADEELFSFLRAIREDFFAVLDDGSLSLQEALTVILDKAVSAQQQADGDCCEAAPGGDIASLLTLFADFEPIDGEWERELAGLHQTADSLAALPPLLQQEEAYMRNLCRYFLWRYLLKSVFDGLLLPRVKFALISAWFIRVMCAGSHDLPVWIQKSKLYSKEMEYSSENRELFYDFTFEKGCLSANCIKQLLRNM